MEKQTYKEALQGKRVQIDYMDDAHPVPAGTKGTITHVDDMDVIHVKWDNGSTLGIVPETDVFHFVN